MDSNWWLLRVLLSRRVTRLAGGLLGAGVVFALFFGPLQGWTQNTIQDRASSLVEWRTKRIEDALGLPAASPTETIRFAVPRGDVRRLVRVLRADGYSVSVEKSERPRWRMNVRDVPATDTMIVRDLIFQLSPEARSLPH